MADYEIVKDMPLPHARGGRPVGANSYQVAVESLDVGETILRVIEGRPHADAYARTCVQICKKKYPGRNFTTRKITNAKGEKCIGLWRLPDTPPATSLHVAAE